MEGTSTSYSPSQMCVYVFVMDEREQSAAKEERKEGLIRCCTAGSGEVCVCTVHDEKDGAGEPSSERKQCEWNNIGTTCRIDTACGDGSDSRRAIV